MYEHLLVPVDGSELSGRAMTASALSLHGAAARAALTMKRRHLRGVPSGREDALIRVNSLLEACR